MKWQNVRDEPKLGPTRGWGEMGRTGRKLEKDVRHEEYEAGRGEEFGEIGYREEGKKREGKRGE